MAEATHMVVTDEGEYGWSAQSPQLPGFVYGRRTLTEFMWDYHDTLRTAGVTGRVLGHPQRRFVSPEGDEYLIRFAEDRTPPGVCASQSNSKCCCVRNNGTSCSGMLARLPVRCASSAYCPPICWVI